MNTSKGQGKAPNTRKGSTMAEKSITARDTATRNSVLAVLSAEGLDLVRISNQSFGAIVMADDGVEDMVEIKVVVRKREDDCCAEDMLDIEKSEYEDKLVKKAEKEKAKQEKIAKDKAKREAQAKAKAEQEQA